MDQLITKGGGASGLVGRLNGAMRSFLFKVLRMGPIPAHFSFIMDGNRRYARLMDMGEGAGHRAGYYALVSVLQYCYELGIKYISIYAFSIDNFKRSPGEVRILMDMILEKMEALLEDGSVAEQYGVRIYFAGNLNLLSERIRTTAAKVMDATSHNGKCSLVICLAYTTCDEIVHAVHESCREKLDRLRLSRSSSSSSCDVDPPITVEDIERNMYMGVAPDPDVLMRSSGEKRLSNYQLWQTSYCTLYSPKALWPDISLWHVVLGVLKFQRGYAYFEKKKKMA